MKTFLPHSWRWSSSITHTAKISVASKYNCGIKTRLYIVNTHKNPNKYSFRCSNCNTVFYIDCVFLQDSCSNCLNSSKLLNFYGCFLIQRCIFHILLPTNLTLQLFFKMSRNLFNNSDNYFEIILCLEQCCIFFYFFG